MLQLLHRGRQQEYGGSAREHPADIGSTVHVNDQHDHLTGLQPLFHLGLQGAVVIAIIEVVLHHLIALQQLLELLTGAVVVIHTLLLAGARGAGGGRDGLFDLGVCLAQRLDHAVLAGTGCTGNYKQKFIIRHEMLLPPLMFCPPALRRGLPPFRAEELTARHDRSP